MELLVHRHVGHSHIHFASLGVLAGECRVCLIESLRIRLVPCELTAVAPRCMFPLAGGSNIRLPDAVRYWSGN